MTSVSDAGSKSNAGSNAGADRSRDAGRAESSKDVGRSESLSETDRAAVESAVKTESPTAEAAALEAGDQFDAETRAEATRAAEKAEVERAKAAAEATAVADVAPETIAEIDAIGAEIEGLGWAEDPAVAQTLSDRLSTALEAVPEADRATVRSDLMGPVDELAQYGLRDSRTGEFSPTRAEAVGAFAEHLGQRGVDGLANGLRTAAEVGPPEARDAIAGALADVARLSHDPHRQRGATQSLMNGPAEVIADGLAGRIDGLGPSELAHLSSTRGTPETDARLRSIADIAAPSAHVALDAANLGQARVPPPNFEDLHAALDVAGMVPGLGEPADALNAVIYAAEGRGLDAGMSAAGVIGIGSVLTGSRIARRAGNATDVPHRSPDAPGAGTAARVIGDRREDIAEAALQRQGFDVQRANLDIGTTDFDLVMTTPRGRQAVLVGGNRKAMENGELSQAAIDEAVDRFHRARDAALDPDGPFRADGAGALMAFDRATTDPRVIDAFIERLGRGNVLTY